MNPHRFSELTAQISALQEELVATGKQLSQALEELVGRSEDLTDCVAAIREAEDTDDDEHRVVDAAYDNYESVIEDLKDQIRDAAGEVDEHLKLGADLRLVLEQVAAEARKPWP
jgi:chromosome segregation ATPase